MIQVVQRWIQKTGTRRQSGMLPVVKTTLPTQGAWVQSLLWELRFHIPRCGQKIKKKNLFNWTKSKLASTVGKSVEFLPDKFHLNVRDRWARIVTKQVSWTCMETSCLFPESGAESGITQAIFNGQRMERGNLVCKSAFNPILVEPPNILKVKVKRKELEGVERIFLTHWRTGVWLGPGAVALFSAVLVRAFSVVVLAVVNCPSAGERVI